MSQIGPEGLAKLAQITNNLKVLKDLQLALLDQRAMAQALQGVELVLTGIADGRDPDEVERETLVSLNGKRNVQGLLKFLLMKEENLSEILGESAEVLLMR